MEARCSSVMLPAFLVGVSDWGSLVLGAVASLDVDGPVQLQRPSPGKDRLDPDQPSLLANTRNQCPGLGASLVRLGEAHVVAGIQLDGRTSLPAVTRGSLRGLASVGELPPS